MYVLQEAVDEVIFRKRSAGRFHSLVPTGWTDKLHEIFLWIPIQRGPTGKTNPHDLFRMRSAIHGQRPQFYDLWINDKRIDAGSGGIDAASLRFLAFRLNRMRSRGWGRESALEYSFRLGFLK